jgi:multidrug resistance protein MdtO
VNGMSACWFLSRFCRPASLRRAEMLRLLMPFPGRLEFTVRLALICALTTLVVEIYQTPDPALTVYVVFFLNKPDRGASLILSIAMVVLISLIIASVLGRSP